MKCEIEIKCDNSMQDLPLFYAPNIAQEACLPEDEAGHAMRVLRLSVGDAIWVTDGKGNLYEASISDTHKKTCRISLGNSKPWQAYWQGDISLCVAPTKSMERMEWLLEKAVEIGVNRIILLKTKHNERKHINAERLRKILVGAMKQSQKALLPELLIDVPLPEAMTITAEAQRLILHCRPAAVGVRERVLPHQAYALGRDVALFIGPEGDFSIEELIMAEEQGAVGVSLGVSRLRTETAALTALQWIHCLQMTQH